MAPKTNTSTRDSYAEDRLSPRLRFDEVETTMSHLFRRPHPALDGRSFGHALYDALVSGGWMTPSPRVLELGAGGGFVAAAICDAAQSQGLSATYGFIDISKPLLRAQRQRLPQGFAIRADAEWLPLGTGAWSGLFLANEVIADLRVDHPTHPDARSLSRRFDLSVEKDTWIHTGALRLLENLARILGPQGTACLTEFGGDRPPVAVTLQGPASAGKHVEHTIDFRQLVHAARTLDFHVELVPLAQFLKVDRSIRVASHLDLLRLRRFVPSLPVYAFPKEELEQKHPWLTRVFALEFPEVGSPRFPTPQATAGFCQSFWALLLKRRSTQSSRDDALPSSHPIE